MLTPCHIYCALHSFSQICFFNIQYLKSNWFPRQNGKAPIKCFKNELLCFVIIMAGSSIFLLKHRSREPYLQKGSLFAISFTQDNIDKTFAPTPGARPSLGNWCCLDTAFYLYFKCLWKIEADLNTIWKFKNFYFILL